MKNNKFIKTVIAGTLSAIIAGLILTLISRSCQESETGSFHQQTTIKSKDNSTHGNDTLDKTGSNTLVKKGDTKPPETPLKDNPSEKKTEESQEKSSPPKAETTIFKIITHKPGIRVEFVFDGIPYEKTSDSTRTIKLTVPKKMMKKSINITYSKWCGIANVSKTIRPKEGVPHRVSACD